MPRAFITIKTATSGIKINIIVNDQNIEMLRKIRVSRRKDFL
jgi:hypothetical protein